METSTRLPTSEPAFHADDTEQVAEYRTVSALAIVSLIFGIASPLCIAWPLLMAIPLIGAAVSIVALRRIDASDGALVGRWAATAGLVLSIVSGTAAVSRDLVTRSIRTQQAEALGHDWIALLLAGDTEQAFRLTVAGNRREPPPPEPGMPVPTTTPYEQFRDHPIVPKLAAAGADAQIRFVETSDYEPQPRRQFIIRQTFLVTPNKASPSSHGDPIEVVLTLQRSQLIGERQFRWLVANHQLPQAEAESIHLH